MTTVNHKLLFKSFAFVLIFFYTENIIAQPVAEFSATPVTGCAPLVVNFTDLSSGNPSGWKWDLGNGTIAVNKNPSVTYFTPGTYEVTLIAKNSSGSDTIVKKQYITVQTDPTVNFTGSPTLGCVPVSVQFTDQSTAGGGSLSAWKWDFGDGTSDSVQNPRHIYASAGTFDVTIQVKNSFGCGGTASKSQFIDTRNSVVADFSNNIQNTCSPPVTLNFQNLSTGPPSINYQWAFGDGSGSSQANPSHTYATAGKFTVQLISMAASGKCADTIQKEIIIGTVTPDFISSSTVCLQKTLALVNTSQPVPVNVLWDFGDGTTSDSLSPVKKYNAPGDYTIKMIADFGACRDSATKPVTVLPKVNITFTANDTAACKAPFTVNFSSSATGATGYQWDFGDESKSSAQNPVHLYSTAGSFNVTLITTNSSGCQDTAKKPGYIKIQAAGISLPYLPLKNCVPFSYTFKATILSSEPVLNYNWDFGDGGTDTSATPTHIFTIVGSYTISLTIITSSGCTTNARIVNGVIVGNKPIANFSAAPLAACASIPINFTDLSTGNVNEWLWDFGDKTTSRAKNPVHAYLDTGFFTVTLTAVSSGCPDTVTFSNYVYIKPPVSRFVIRPNCALPFQKAFIDSSRGAESWQWDFGDGSMSALRNPVHVFADTGTYPITLKVSNLSTGCDNTITRNIQVIKEKANFIASDTTLCKGSTIYFKSRNNSAKISVFNWNYGDGTPEQNARDSVVHKYILAGSFTARLITTDVLGCKDTLVKPLYIKVTGPVANFKSSFTSCVNASVAFVDSSRDDGRYPIIKWAWDYGDGTTEILSGPPFRHTYTKTGTYSVKLTVTDSNGCTDSLIKKNYLFISKPLAGFTSNDTVTCPTSPVQFSNTAQGVNLTYLWNFGDGDTSSMANPVHQYLFAGNFTVSLTVTDRYGCTDSIQKQNYVAVTLPLANFTLNDSISACPPFFVTFNNSSKNYTTALWDFGDGNFSSSINATHFYNIPGSYIVTLKVTGPGGCFDEKLNTIVVKGPKGVLNYTNIAGCNFLKTDFKASAKDNLLFTWDFNDGTTVKTRDSLISHTYAQPGFYLPKLILEDVNGCQVPILGIDTIKVISVQANFSALSKIICSGGDVSFIDSTVSNDMVSNWSWNFGDGLTSFEKSPVHNYSSAGLFTISQIVTTAIGCKDTVVKNGDVKVIAKPDINIQSSAGRCASDTVIFKGIFLQPDTSKITWQWTFGNGQSSSLQDPLPQLFSPAGAYSVTLIAVNSPGCKDTATQMITINPRPAVDAGIDIFLCQGSSAQLQASGATAYQWIAPSNFLSCINCANPVTSATDNITYKVSGTNGFGCVALDSITVRVKKPFTLTVAPLQDSLCIGERVQLNASFAEKYLWAPANGLSSTVLKNPMASPTTNIIYKVIGYDSANCFKDSAFVNIAVFNYPLAEAGADKTIRAGASVVLAPVYSNDIVDYFWTPGTALDCTDCPAPVAMPGSTTTYTITVKNSGGCSASDKVTVFTTCKSENIFIPNTFSPNGDGVNDVFYPRGTGLNRIRGLQIFNRWGGLVFERSNFYANDPAAGWDGSAGGKTLTPDVFTFIIDIICDNNDVIALRGNITLIK